MKTINCLDKPFVIGSKKNSFVNDTNKLVICFHETT